MKRILSAFLALGMVLSLFLSPISAEAATNDTAFIVKVVGSTSVSYKSCHDGYPGTNNQSIEGANYAMGYGENGLARPQTDSTGTWTCPADGSYQFELKGGGGAAAFLDCASARMACGGAGGHIIVNANLKKGDVITYSAAAGGCQASGGHSVAYDGRNAACAIGAQGRDSWVAINGTKIAIAYGGKGALRFCLQRDGDNAWYDSVIAKYGFQSAHKIRESSDDPAVGGLGGGHVV